MRANVGPMRYLKENGCHYVGLSRPCWATGVWPTSNKRLAGAKWHRANVLCERRANKTQQNANVGLTITEVLLSGNYFISKNPAAKIVTYIVEEKCMYKTENWWCELWKALTKNFHLFYTSNIYMHLAFFFRGT